MIRPKKKPGAVQRTLGSIKSQFLSDVKGFAAGLKDPLNYKDPSPERTAKSKKAVEDLRKNNKRPPKKDPVADAAAARMAKTKEEGRKRRIKFEKAQGEKAKKRRALLLNIRKAKK